MERLRQALITDLIHLESLQSAINHTQLLETDDFDDPHAELFDNLDGDGGEADPCRPDELIDKSNTNHVILLPECRPLHLPSSHLTNNHHPFRQAKLTLQIKQATWYLASVQEAIVQKLFQYSHVMHSAPSNGI